MGLATGLHVDYSKLLHFDVNKFQLTLGLYVSTQPQIS